MFRISHSTSLSLVACKSPVLMARRRFSPRAATSCVSFVLHMERFPLLRLWHERTVEIAPSCALAGEAPGTSTRELCPHGLNKVLEGAPDYRRGLRSVRNACREHLKLAPTLDLRSKLFLFQFESLDSFPQIAGDNI
jgi:hypothetical protein